MKRVVVVLLVMCLTLPLFARGSDEGSMEDGKTTVSVWIHSGKPEERSAFGVLIEDFNTLQESVQAEVLSLPEASYNESVNAAALAGDLPDVLDFDGPNLYNYAWAGNLIPLDDYISPELMADLLPSIIDQGTYAGNIWALGQFDSGLAFWANKSYLEEAGVRIPTSYRDAWSLEEFNDALAKLQALPQVEYALDLKMNYGQGEWYTYGFSPFLQSFGGDLIDRSDFQSAEGVLNGPEAVAFGEAFQALFEQGYVDVAPPADDSFFGTKTAALAWVGHWMTAPHTEGLGSDAILVPAPDFGNGPKTGMGSWCWGITSTAADPDAAWKFMEYMMSPNSILLITAENGAVPARFSALERDSRYAEGGLLYTFKEQLENIAVPRPQTPAYPTITSVFAEAIQNIATGADVKAELDRAVERIDQDIEDNRGYPVN